MYVSNIKILLHFIRIYSIDYFFLRLNNIYIYNKIILNEIKIHQLIH